MTASSDDRTLLARIRAGDKEACAECIKRYTPDVRRLALRLMRDEAEAEDVVQETFLRAFKGIHEFDGRSQLRTWLYRIAYNTALMHHRRTRPEVVPIDEVADPAEGAIVPRALFDWCCLPEPEVAEAEVRAELASAIRAMPATLRAAFVMRELDGLSTEATAEALGVSQDVVKTRLRRGRLWLRTRLAAYFSLAVPPLDDLAEARPDG
jgi:RNA polymerase sigma-70 factor, ECF subfamily